ncbi:MAG: hypothetical protein COB90_01240 [Hyphomicrobiales bacterium]|nr:MAG: hypothetical protein COB90_01240 [Hyphomicrobiales bacterium]
MSKHFISNSFDAETLLAVMLDTAHQGFMIFDKKLDILAINERAMELLELPRDLSAEGVNLSVYFRFNAERGDYGSGNIEEQIEQRLSLAALFTAHDFERERPDGTIIRVQGTPHTAGGFVSIFTDVTRERTAETQLAESQNELENQLFKRTKQLRENRDLLFSAFDAIPDALILTNKLGVITHSNSNMKNFHPGVEQAIDNQETVYGMFPTLAEKPWEIQGTDTASRRSFECELFGDRWFRVQTSSIPKGGQIMIFSDISDYKNQQHTLQKNMSELTRHLRREKKMNEMQREFVSMASHEFRTPLAIIDSNAQKLIRRFDRLEPDQIKTRGENVRAAVVRMQSLMTSFLESSSAQAGDIELKRKVQPLESILRCACETQQKVCQTHFIELKLEELEHSINVDSNMLEHCFSNLLSNAIKYSPDADSVIVHAFEKDNKVLIQVTDQGLGIPAAEVAKVFNRYFRASTSAGIAGTGLGLNLTEMIVEAHKGTISLTSIIGEGSTFTITLPFAAEAAEPDQKNIAKAS